MRISRGIAWVLTLLLTVLLTFTLMGTVLMQALTSETLHQQAATDEKIIYGQLQRIYTEIDALAEEYGFSAETVKQQIDREDLLQINRENAQWWTRLLTAGTRESAPSWDSEGILEAVLDTIQSGSEEKSMEATVMIAKAVQAAIHPVRETVLSYGFGYLNRRINLPEVMRFASKAPLLGLTVCLLIAGLVALLSGKKLRDSLLFYGTAAAGAALSVLAAGILIRILNPAEMLQEAAEGFAGEYGNMMRSIGIEAAVLVLGLLAGGMICLWLYRRNPENHKKTGATTA